jgi:hypothetical protein
LSFDAQCNINNTLILPRSLDPYGFSYQLNVLNLTTYEKVSFITVVSPTELVIYPQNCTEEIAYTIVLIRLVSEYKKTTTVYLVLKILNIPRVISGGDMRSQEIGLNQAA